MTVEGKAPCAVAWTTVIGVVTPLRVTVIASLGAQLPPVNVVVPPRLVVDGVATSVAATAPSVMVVVAVRLLISPIAVSVCVPRVAV